MNAITVKTLSPVSLVMLMSLLTPLTLPTARAFRWDDAPYCHENQRPPKIVYKSTSMQTFEDPGEFTEILYGEDITVLCTAGDVIKLRVQKSDEQLHINKLETYLEIEEVNNTAIRWNISRPDVGRIRYRCVDTNSRCQDSLYFMVAPLVSVVSTSVHHMLRSEFDKRYIFYVPVGESYQIFCTGSEAGLTIRSNSWALLPTTVLNATTVTYEGRSDQVDTFYYTCSGKETAWFQIIVDYPPEAKEFRCTSYNYDKLACTWLSSSPANTFNLFFNAYYEGYKLLCTNRLVGINRECKWSKRFIWDTIFFRNYDISLRIEMQSCNDVFCRNQTFEMPHIGITKLDPVSNLTVTNRSNGVVVSWPAPHQGFSIDERRRFKHDYKVEYRLLHKRWRQAAAAVRCDYNQCASELSLDCPEQHYELRVYVKLEGAADRLWSEPAARSFYTGATDDAPTACRTALREPELLSGGRALSELYELISRAMEGRAVLRQQVRDMRLKLREIESLPGWVASSGAAGGNQYTL